MEKNKSISILGSTGSIGTQSLEVISETSGIQIEYLTTNSNIELLEQQCKIYNPKSGVVVCDEYKYKEFKNSTSYKGEVLFGNEGLSQVTSQEDTDLVISSLVGFSGVIPTLNAIKNGIDIALANKETLVAAGSIITRIAKENNVNIFPIDSEHSAIQQCLVGEDISDISKIILTASGGPFLNLPANKFETITLSDALNHPNWEMGSKITIDSATLMNKGLEVIEAYWLFGIEIEDIEVVVHPQSIIHSMVEFNDTSVKAQLGLPDMKVPIAYALNFPKHQSYNYKRLDLTTIGNLTFSQPDYKRFPNLSLAFESIKKGGTTSAILNAVNEITVDSFLKEKITFTNISNINSYMLDKIESIDNPSLEDIINADKEARIKTIEHINQL
jgi:1-deoxy-D-xylulose-5-phosphate reductoisomerase